METLETEGERERTEQLKDIFHEHQPLVFNEKKYWDPTKATFCSACGRPMSGESYSCTDCDFHLHKKCGEAPLKLNHHPLHSKHSPLNLLVQSSDDFRCEFCWKRGMLIGYECISCHFSLDVHCALFPSPSENSEIFNHYAHPHPLLLLQNHTYEFEQSRCTFCEQPLLGSVYVCLESCYFGLHKKCADLPTEINHHPCHRNHIHPLILDIVGYRSFCQLCQDEHWGYFYRCWSCQFDVHFKCAWLSLVIKYETHHDHPFHLFFRQVPFICDACGTEGKYISYICFTCHLQVHPKCTSLPRVIKITRHKHPLFHNYFAQKEEVQNQECRICFEQVKTRHGSYYCSKPDCNYIVHVNCATKYPKLYSIVDPENLDEAGEISELVEPSITSIIEVNQCGDAKKIKHFSHDHYLILSDNVNEGEDQHCNGCVISISGSFYNCSECDFVLHKSCAELPRKWYHWFLPDLLTLYLEGIFECDYCRRQCSGFFYKPQENSYPLICLKCANITDTLEHPGHKHLLFCDNKYGGKCTSCGVEVDFVYRCTKKCDFALDIRCIALPHTVQHKCDEHFFKLSYGDKNDYPKSYFCDICEKSRDPNLWFYHCSICDTSVHPKCVLRKHPPIKIGSMYKYEHHLHALNFVQQMYYYPRCARCHQPCEDWFLECAPCNYVVHWKCIHRTKFTRSCKLAMKYPWHMLGK